jgi:hypothetical protein
MDCKMAKASEEKKKRDEAFINLQQQKCNPRGPSDAATNTTVRFPHQHINWLMRLK